MPSESDHGDIGEIEALRAPVYDGLQTLQAVVSALENGSDALAALDEAITYLAGTVIPLVRAEEFTFFTAVDGALGSPEATRVLIAQHDSIVAMARDLETVRNRIASPADVPDYGRYLGPLLHGLYAVIRVHVESEDTIFLPLLQERLSPSQVEMLATNLRRVRDGFAAQHSPASRPI